MTRTRIHGSDVPFCAWFRAQPDLESNDVGISFSDVDVIIHRYKIEQFGIIDRQIQAMMNLEIKTRGWCPERQEPAQLDTFGKMDLCCRNTIEVQGKNSIETIRHFGVFFLHMDGTNPDDSTRFTWYHFEEQKSGKNWRLIPHTITKDQIVQLARFELNPFSMTPMQFGSWESMGVMAW